MSTVLDLIGDLLKPESRPASPNARPAASRADTGESPLSPLSPEATAEVATPAIEETELQRLVRACGVAYAFSEEEHREALQIALADPENAFTCFRAMAAKLGLQPPERLT